MNRIAVESLNLDELCEATAVPSGVIVEIVEHGIVEPIGRVPTDWQFSVRMVVTTRRALRLHRDLDIDWPGIAFALSLIEEVEQLRVEKQQLLRRLGRFTVES